MANKKYTETDVKLWAKLYLEGRTLQNVANFCKVPKSSVRKLLEPLNILRPPQKKGRTPWNKDKKTGQIPWNKGMSESGTYPFPSPDMYPQLKVFPAVRKQKIKLVPQLEN